MGSLGNNVPDPVCGLPAQNPLDISEEHGINDKQMAQSPDWDSLATAVHAML